MESVTSPDDPMRCQHVIPAKGQCHNVAVKEGSNCMAHGGAATVRADNKKRTTAYKLHLYQQRLEEHTGFINLKSLQDEIGLMRMLVEERINRCEDIQELSNSSASIADLVMKVERLVVSCQKLDAALGKHIDASALIAFAGIVITLVTEIFPDDDTKVKLLADKLLDEVKLVNE